MPRQEYIARVRYQNVLPPPPGAPKLLDYGVDLAPLLTAGSLSSAVFDRRLSLEPDADLGVPLDLTLFPEAFEVDGEAESEAADAELDPADLELLEEPVPTKVTSSSATAVGSTVSSLHASSSRSVTPGSADLSSDAAASIAFLRHKSGSAGSGTGIHKPAATVRGKSQGPEFDAEAELRKIEATFDAAQIPLSELRHPKKPGLKAVRSFPVVPDLAQFDLERTSVRMVGSAGLRHLPMTLEREQLETAVFASCGPSEEESWMSFFVPQNNEDAAQIKERLKDSRDTLPRPEVEAESSTVWPLRKIQDNDTEVNQHKNEFEEIVLTTDGSTVFYAPISSRTNFKRRRVDPKRREALREHEVDILDLQLREVTAEESINRDERRSRFDPVTYGS